MTITHLDGTRKKAILLSRSTDTLRVAVEGENDSAILTLMNGTWITESCDPVAIEFEWQSCAKVRVPKVADCVCSKEEASRLIASLLNPGQEVATSEAVHVLSAAGLRVPLQPGEWLTQ